MLNDTAPKVKEYEAQLRKNSYFGLYQPIRYFCLLSHTAIETFWNLIFVVVGNTIRSPAETFVHYTHL